MGGFGSGRWQGHDKKIIVEEESSESFGDKTARYRFSQSDRRGPDHLHGCRNAHGIGFAFHRKYGCEPLAKLLAAVVQKYSGDRAAKKPAFSVPASSIIRHTLTLVLELQVRAIAAQEQEWFPPFPWVIERPLIRGGGSFHGAGPRCRP